jgi:hypothetical protein
MLHMLRVARAQHKRRVLRFIDQVLPLSVHLLVVR